VVTVVWDAGDGDDEVKREQETDETHETEVTMGDV
tara:strand:- start:392 stop:496 length:105 start_codon:yes stop_codon:yes gene_type:complete